MVTDNNDRSELERRVYDVPPEVMQKLSDEFNQMTMQRHVAGAEEYSEFAFLKNDMVQFIAEELADLSNYARYMYMKIRLWEEVNNAGSLDLSNFRVGGSTSDTVQSDFASSADATEVSPVLSED
jgi:hypothetical protein